MEAIKNILLIVIVLALDFMACYIAETSACKNALKKYRENPAERNGNKYAIEHSGVFYNRKYVNKYRKEKPDEKNNNSK